MTYDDVAARWAHQGDLTAEELTRRDDEFRAVIPEVIARETQLLRALERAGATYLVNGERNLVHTLTCPTIRRMLDRERMWREEGEHVIAQYRHTLGGPFHGGPKMPTLLTRPEVEELTRYDTCAVCAPETDTLRKRGRAL